MNVPLLSRRIAAVVLSLLGLMIWIGPAAAQKRVALVVGNNVYPDLPATMQLRNAISDARAVRDTLKGLGFDVIHGENLDRKALVDRTFDLASKLGAGDTAFFFFAGHGVSFSGANYLLPTDVPTPRGGGRAEEGRLADLAVAETQIIERITASGARVAIVVLDACRDNPLQSGDKRSIGGTRGLSQGAPPRGVFSIYSAGFGQAALDRLGPDDRNPNSVFTRVFIDKLKAPGLDLKVVATETRRSVAEMAEKVGHEQFPAYYDQIVGGDVYLAGLPQAAVAIAPAPVIAPALPAPVAQKPAPDSAMQGRLQQEAREQEARKRAEESIRQVTENARKRSEEEKQKVAAVSPAAAPPAKLATGTTRSLAGHADEIKALAFSTDSRLLVTGSRDKTARLWDVSSALSLHTTPKQKDSVSTVAFSRDSRLWAMAQPGQNVTLWDASSGKLGRSIAAKTPAAILFTADGKQVLSNIIFGLAFFDSETGKEMRRLDLGYHVEQAALSPDGRAILALTRDPGSGLTEPRLLNIENGSVIRTYPDHKWTAAVALSADGRSVATGGDDNVVRVLDADSGRERWSRTEEGKVRAVAFSPDGRLVAIGCLTSAVMIRSADTGELVRQLDDSDGVSALSFSPDGRVLAFGYRSGMLKVIDIVPAASPATARQ